MLVSLVAEQIRARSSWHRSAAWLLALLALWPFALTFIEWSVIGAEAFVGDVRTWTTVAEHVLDGTPPYQATETTDIKPPGWILFAVASEALFQAGVVIVLLTALANAVGVWLAYAAGLRVTGSPRAAVAAAGLTLVALSGLGGFGNNKTLAAVLLVGALVARSSLRGAVLLGLSLAVAQHALLGVPAVLWRWRRTVGWRGTSRVALVAVGVLALGYLPLAYWGWESIAGGLEYSYGIGFAYVSGRTIAGAMYTGKGGVLASPGKWATFARKGSAHVAWVAIPSLVGGLHWLHRPTDVARDPGRRHLTEGLLLMALSLLPILLVRAYLHYWAMVAVVLGPLSAVGIEVVLADAGE